MSASEICGILDRDLVQFIHNIVVILKIAVPIILVILGMIDFAKGVASSKEDEIKKGQQTFIHRLIAAACVFFVVTIVQLVMSLVSSDDNSFWSCANGILNGTAGKEYNIDTEVPSGYEDTDADVNNNSGNVDNGSTDNNSGNVNNGSTDDSSVNVDGGYSAVDNDLNVRCSNNTYLQLFRSCFNSELAFIPNEERRAQSCRTIYQDYCTVVSGENDLLWASSTFDESLIPSQCNYLKSQGGNGETIYKQIGSCIKSYKSVYDDKKGDNAYPMALQSCDFFFNNYCDLDSN